MENALIIKDLVAGYNNKIILKKISFNVPKGMITAIVGGSGSGKSTILKHLIGLMKPLSGQIIAYGYDLTTLDEKGLNEYR
ncbi:MAG: ATP-binding cassette domain-containing protein, partial [Thermodesulfovibrionales bacterium]|nr:ATP-binding cassette domain-containing protein [Thermodesulfovibrionales bacterium]